MFDVAVIGGGPAGCSAAITLAQHGAKVVMFEAKAYPHHKVCGEFLSPECANLLDQLGAALPIGAVPIHIARITAPDDTTWETCLPGTAWGVSRFTLDAHLADRARKLGVEICERATVASVQGDLKTGFQLNVRKTAGSDQIRSRVVIAAHGKRAGLDRALNRRFLKQPQPFIALKAHFRGPSLPGRIELHTFPGGYCGMSEIEDGSANVCLLAHETAFAQHNQPNSVDAFIAWMQTQNPYLRRWLSQAEPITEHWLSISQIPFDPKDIVLNDVLMAGDAAGLIVPLAGDGISMALQSGRLAASHTAKFLAGEVSAGELKHHYIEVWQREFGARLWLARALQTIMLRPRLLSMGLRLLNIAPPLADYLVRQTRDSRLPIQ
jgi:flavin-dependent dehydrogenase